MGNSPWGCKDYGMTKYANTHTHTHTHTHAHMHTRKGIEIIQSLFSFFFFLSVLLLLWNYVRKQYQKIFENNSLIFKHSVTFTKKDLWLTFLYIHSINF